MIVWKCWTCTTEEDNSQLPLGWTTAVDSRNEPVFFCFRCAETLEDEHFEFDCDEITQPDLEPVFLKSGT